MDHWIWGGNTSPKDTHASGMHLLTWEPEAQYVFDQLKQTLQ